MKPICPFCLVFWLVIGAFAGLLIYSQLRRFHRE